MHPHELKMRLLWKRSGNRAKTTAQPLHSRQGAEAELRSTNLRLELTSSVFLVPEFSVSAALSGFASALLRIPF
jgi:hypothetical protein